MGLESVTYTEDLNQAWPEGTEFLSDADNHLRNIKKAIKNTFPSVTGAWRTTAKAFVGTPDGADPKGVVTVDYLEANAVTLPIGYPQIWLLDTLPTNHLELNGQAISRTTYAALFTLYGTTYGAGNGTTTFNLPDMRGRFLRVVDNGAGIDPDAGSRTNRGDSQTGDKVGTKQADAIRAHNHDIKGLANAGGGGGASVGRIDKAGGAVNSNWQTENNTGNETRPVNIAIKMIVRAL